MALSESCQGWKSFDHGELRGHRGIFPMILGFTAQALCSPCLSSVVKVLEYRLMPRSHALRAADAEQAEAFLKDAGAQLAEGEAGGLYGFVGFQDGAGLEEGVERARQL